MCDDIPCGARYSLFDMTTYLALLRGINVGGNNVIRMADLRAFLAERGFDGVRTYIQSGNVIWNDAAATEDEARSRIGNALSDLLANEVTSVVLSAERLAAIVAGAPTGFGGDPDAFRYDVMFLMPELDARAVAADLPVREGVDTAVAGDGAVFFTRRIDAASRSYMPKIVGTPIYRQMTIRNWNTTTRLLGMVDGRNS